VFDFHFLLSTAEKQSKFCNFRLISLDAGDREYFTLEGDLCGCSSHITFPLHMIKLQQSLPLYAQVC